jgi:hypothetical protein
MTDRATLTARYLDEVAGRGQTAADLLAVMPTTGILAERYGKQYLPRPLFLGHAEASQVNSDLWHIRAALAGLPGLLYDGDLAAFARAAGLADVQIDAVRRSRAGQVTEWVRADLYPGAEGLRMMEFNMGSGIAGSDNGEICQAMLRYPPLRQFARTHRLNYADTMQEQVRLIFAESGFKPDSYPVIALAVWPGRLGRIGTYLHKVARRWRDGAGLHAHACHLGQLKFRDGRVWLRGRPVDIIFRIFLIERLLEPGGPELILPLLDAASRGQVAMFTSIESDLYGSKVPLAMLSDHANRHLLTPAQRAAVDRVLPWTRMVRPGPVTLEDGSTVDLMDYALGHPEDLVLKPSLLHGGIGVVPGWQPDTTEQVWRDALNQAMGGPYVLQRRIRVIPELSPDEGSEPAAWETTWGAFPRAAGLGGVYVRAFQVQTGLAVTQWGPHLHYTGCLVEQPGPPAQG